MIPSESPVFVHSLFRSGSTYIFNVFRRSQINGQPRFTAYQESIHELMVLSTKNRDQLLEVEALAQATLRHQNMSQPHFQEAFDTFDAWSDFAAPEIVYDDYFGAAAPDKTVAFFRSLMTAASARPVFQECRTSMRIEGLKSALGGVHIHLWRNPWDQWWSLNISDYFSAALLVALHAEGRPAALTRLVKDLQFADVSARSMGDKIQYYRQHPLDFEDSYRVFYSFWIFAMISARDHCDIEINIDSLSTDENYREQTQSALAMKGISGLDFSDCQSPQSIYSGRDVELFRSIERSVEKMLVSNGVDAALISDIQAMRDKYAPKVQTDVGSVPLAALRSLETVRESFRFRHNENAAQARSAQQEIMMTHLRLQEAHQELSTSRQTAVNSSEALNTLTKSVDISMTAMSGSLAALAERGAEVERKARAALEAHRTQVAQLEHTIETYVERLKLSEAEKAQSDLTRVELEQALTSLRSELGANTARLEQITSSRAWKLLKMLR